MTFFDRTEHWIEKLAAGLAIAGGLGLIFATLATCVSIILRLCRRLLENFVDSATLDGPLTWVRPILGEEELVTYGVGLALFAALPWVMIKRGHIKIDLFEPAFGRRFNHFLDLLGDLILAALAYLIMTRQWFLIFKTTRGSKEPALNLLLKGDFAQAGNLMRTSQESQILGVPLWPTYIVAEFCIAVFFVVACFCVLRSARAFIQNHTRSAEHA